MQLPTSNLSSDSGLAGAFFLSGAPAANTGIAALPGVAAETDFAALLPQAPAPMTQTASAESIASTAEQPVAFAPAPLSPEAPLVVCAPARLSETASGATSVLAEEPISERDDSREPAPMLSRGEKKDAPSRRAAQSAPKAPVREEPLPEKAMSPGLLPENPAVLAGVRMPEVRLVEPVDFPKNADEAPAEPGVAPRPTAESDDPHPKFGDTFPPAAFTSRTLKAEPRALERSPVFRAFTPPPPAPEGVSDSTTGVPAEPREFPEENLSSVFEPGSPLAVTEETDAAPAESQHSTARWLEPERPESEERVAVASSPVAERQAERPEKPDTPRAIPYRELRDTDPAPARDRAPDHEPAVERSVSRRNPEVPIPAHFSPAASPRSEILPPPFRARANLVADEAPLPPETDEAPAVALPEKRFAHENARPDFAAASAPARPSGTGQANFAVLPQRVAAVTPAPRNEPEKSFLAASDKRDTKPSASLGTDVAKPAASMPARFLPAPWQQHPAFEYAPASVVGTGVLDEAPVQTGTLERSEAVSNAHQAVEVVLRAVDDLSSRTQKSVRLEFSVAGDDLSVRVELHADEVRTTFRTDSPELRAALSQEWQALAGSAAGDRSVRIVPAIFNAAENSALNGFANDASSHHREPGSQPQAMFERSTVFASSDRSAVLPAAHVTPVPATRTHTSRHLHTLA